MTWDQVMEYEDAAKRMARTWCGKTDTWQDVEDVTHELLLMLAQLDTSRCTNGDVDNYINGALWKYAHRYLLDGRNGRWRNIMRTTPHGFFDEEVVAPEEAYD